MLISVLFRLAVSYHVVTPTVTEEGAWNAQVLATCAVPGTYTPRSELSHCTSVCDVSASSALPRFLVTKFCTNDICLVVYCAVLHCAAPRCALLCFAGLCFAGSPMLMLTAWHVSKPNPCVLFLSRSMCWWRITRNVLQPYPCVLSPCLMCWWWHTFGCLFQELIRKTKDSVVKEKEDEDARMKSQAKRLDYITRALRIEEMPVLRKKYEAQVNLLPACVCYL